MDYKFLHKVLDQIVSETKIDYDGEIIYILFSNRFTPNQSHISYLNRIFRSFNNHCKDVYGLNDDEVDYVWEEYKQIIKDKLKNNG